MVDQTKINDGSGETTVIHNLAEFVSDVFTLTELQIRLFSAELREGLDKLWMPLIACLVGGGLLLSCLPIALAVCALFIAESTQFTLAQSFLIVLIAGMLIAVGTLLGAIGYLRSGRNMFTRSINECESNTKWMKGVLNRLSQPTPLPTERSTVRTNY